MNLSGLNSALHNYISQAKDAREQGDTKNAARLFFEAASVAIQISKQSTDIKIKSQYFEMSKSLLEIKDNLIKEIDGSQTPTKNTKGADEKDEEHIDVLIKENKTVTKEEALEKLKNLIGLDSVKSGVDRWVKQLEGQKIREKRNLKTQEPHYHMVFKGSPGTGKTTVARIIGQIFCAMGIVSKGQLVEVDRSNLVAGYVGQTAIKTRKVIDEAMGGVLFIDEAYSLAQGGENDFGNEAISTILKAMEDIPDFVVIVAGYDEPMQDFIDSNPGLKSRFCKTFYFEDYSADEMYAIFCKLVKDNDYILADDVKEELYNHFTYLFENKDKNFGNAREVRNLFEQIISIQNSRLDNTMNDDELKLIKKEDLEEAIR